MKWNRASYISAKRHRRGQHIGGALKKISPQRGTKDDEGLA
jgi:hypothetical protein